MPLSYVTITGTFEDGTGAPLSGTVTFTPSATVYSSGAAIVSEDSPITAKVTGGQLAGPGGSPLQLLPTDTGSVAEGMTGFWYWNVTVSVAGTQTWSFFLPSSPSTVDLYELAATAAGGGGSGAGTVASVAVQTANGFAGTVANPTTTPAITLETTVTGLLKGTGTGLSAATAADVPGFDGVTVTGTPSAGQVPTATSSSAATWQAAAGGVQSLTFTYGSTGAVPSSGTFTAGAVAVDQNDVMRVCITDGTPGTWRRADSQPYQFFVEDYGAKADGTQMLVTVTAGNAQITSATPVFTSTAADSGKNIMICGAGGAIPGGPWIDTITSVQSSTQATLSTTSPGPSNAGLAAVFSSDDRTAIDNCVQAALTYALAHSYYAQVLFQDKIYGLGASFFQSEAGVSGATLTYNAQVRIPVPADQSGGSGKLEFQFTGAGTGGHCQFWDSKNNDMPGTALVSYSIGPNGTPDPTFGQQSIMGAPSGGTGHISDNHGFFNAKTAVSGITLVQPGWSNSIGADFQWVAGCELSGVTSTAFAPSTSGGGGLNPYSTWISQSFWLDNKIAAGFRLPNAGNNDDVVLDSVTIQGLNNGLYTEADHVIIRRMTAASVDKVVNFTSLAANTHAINIEQLSWENCNSAVVVSAGTGAKIQCSMTLDGENATISGFDVSDPDGDLYGVLYWSDQFRSPPVPTVRGAANLKIISNMLGPGHWASAPAVPATTVAQQNTAWRDATVTIATGAGVTVSAVAVDGTATGAAVAASSSATVRVPSGKNITLTYSGGTPTWVWVLD